MRLSLDFHSSEIILLQQYTDSYRVQKMLQDQFATPADSSNLFILASAQWAGVCHPIWPWDWPQCAGKLHLRARRAFHLCKDVFVKCLPLIHFISRPLGSQQDDWP